MKSLILSLNGVITLRPASAASGSRRRAKSSAEPDPVISGFEQPAKPREGLGDIADRAEGGR
ncbi:MAG TPA: hypothetical protein VMV92_23455 [Streptosporangiaceae bacterium]|nr:hypothetical protein [Streptosporangiaceae bacterium]